MWGDCTDWYSPFKPMTKEATSRERILEAACDLFHAQGVSATGLDQILERSSTGKGQFYHHFAGKEALVLAVLREFHTRIREGVASSTRKLAGLDDLESWFMGFVEGQRKGGCRRNCPIATIGVELQDGQEELREEARAVFTAGREALTAFFARLKEQGKLRRTVQPASLADFCFAIMQGGLLVAKVERRSEPFENAVKQAMAHVRSLRS